MSLAAGPFAIGILAAFAIAIQGPHGWQKYIAAIAAVTAGAWAGQRRSDARSDGDREQARHDKFQSEHDA